MTQSQKTARTQTRTQMDERTSVILDGVLQVIRNSKSGEWVGTMTQLRRQVSRLVGQSIVPRSPAAMRTAVNRILSRIRNAGVSVKFGRTTDSMRTRYVKFTAR